ncbi:glycosyltransferase family 4 protein [Rivularia sp. UHCC 0363]|uniref:glycosyltransferase family 4 protein n=1 Tax=Rivularia sp. UHCC 0363 TaxID=3110244 RepID=UPI002B215829|nr:glycosyltransferase family 4 protein [Rivularia sp. UHCC 0363]MEA5594131.1 glycosyltransferase family 4 protein [Rivularia sp. UHCC 0363]
MTSLLSPNKTSNSEKNIRKKLIIIPAYCNSLGGTTVSLLMLAIGFARTQASDQLCILIRKGSFMEKYFRDAGQESCIELIEADNSNEFLKSALRWVNKQPKHYPLLLDNLVWRSYLPILTLFAPSLRLSGRQIYHFCHDLALSYNKFGYLARKVAFTSLAPGAICNSQFTASHIRGLMPDIRGILYQPVDLEKFNQKANNTPPDALKPIIDSGARIMLTPSRINKPGIINDKNLRSLIPVLAHLNQMGGNYHAVVMGEDQSPENIYSQDLLESATNEGVADRFTILPPALNIEDYYKHADIVVTLAPREPFGRTVVEAIACGVPVVGSNTGGINEILQNFAPEWTVNPDNFVEVAQTIMNVAQNLNTKDLLSKGNDWVYANCSLSSYAIGMMQFTGLSS